MSQAAYLSPFPCPHFPFPSQQAKPVEMQALRVERSPWQAYLIKHGLTAQNLTYNDYLNMRHVSYMGIRLVGG
jgi:hypothetical protein